MKKIPVLICLLVCCLSSFCQETDLGVIDLTTIGNYRNISNQTYLLIDSTRKLSPEEAVKRPFTPLTSFTSRSTINPKQVPRIYYIRFTLYNPSDTSRTVFIKSGNVFSGIQFYKVIDSKAIEYNLEGSNFRYKKIIIGPKERFEAIERLELSHSEKNTIDPELIADGFYNDYMNLVQDHDANLIIIGYVLSGILLMMIIFSLANYYLGRRKEFLYYLFYALCTFLLVFLYSFLHLKGTWMQNVYIGYLDCFLLNAGIIFYIGFTRKFLDTKINYPRLETIFKNTEWILLLILGIFSYLHFFTNDFPLENFVEMSMKMVALVVSVIYIVIGLFQKNRLMNYLIAGNIAMVVFSIISFVLIGAKGFYLPVYKAPMLYFETGIVLELSLFLLGLTYKNRLELIETIKDQEALKAKAAKLQFANQLAVLKAQQEERNRISADMHDDLGGGVTAICLYSELAKQRIGDTEMPELDKISSSANELLNKMNAIIWTMDSSNDILGNLVAYIRTFALDFFEDSNIQCRINIPHNIPPIEINGEKRRNIYLTIKEALNNIMKHSKASAVTIEFCITNKLKISVQDNGIGLDMDNTREFGNGLKNMKKRIEKYDGQFNIANNYGTLVELTMPL